MNDVRGLQCCSSINMVYKNSIHAGIHGSLYIGIQIVAKHNSFCKCSAGFVYGKLKNFFLGLRLLLASLVITCVKYFASPLLFNLLHCVFSKPFVIKCS